MKHTFVTILSLFMFLGLSAQNKGQKSNLSGQWKGTITQDEGGYKTNYDFEIYLTQSGDKITGRSYVYIDDIFAIMELKGTVKSDKVILIEETRIVDHRKHEDMEWCIKKSQLILKYDGEVLKLDGYWQGSSVLGECVPGQIHLTQEIPRA